ncbi:MAG: nitroreductase family protein [Candidatus Omnitrophota bacterium]
MKVAISYIVIFFSVISCSLLFAQNQTISQDALTVIHNRKSVRHFTGKVVSPDDLTTIVKAGMAAPTAVNMQPWAFVVITDRVSLDALANAMPYAKMLDKAGAAIVVCAIPAKAFQSKEEFAIVDATCASENILLAAEALGLGAVWTAVYPEKDRMDAVRKQLNIPEGIIPLNIIPIGYPTFEDKPKDKFKKENIYWEKWGTRA